MSTKYIASNWRLPNEENSNKNDNYGLSFDGSEFINLGNPTTLQFTSDFSISGWFKTSSTSAGRIISKDNLSNRSYLVQIQADGSVIGVVFESNSTAKVVTSSTGYNDSNWHHFGFTYEQGVGLKLYIDGETPATLSYTSAPNFNQAANVEIGRRGDGFNYFDGSISELAVFDYTLSESQISTLYGSSELGSTSPMALKPQPVGYWPLGDNSASNPLTQPNEAVEDASVFDFSNSATDFISSDVNITGDWSVSMWINTDSTSYQTALQLSSQATTGTQDSIIFVRNTFESNKWGFYDGSTVLLGSVLDINKWHNLMLTKNGTTYTLFLNGTQESQSTKLNINITDLLIGKRSYSGFFFDGQISNVVLWNSDQSSEKDNIYNSGVPATSYTNTPTAWYKLDQSANWEADSTGAWQIPDAVSSYPQSFNFDGSDDYISASIDGTGGSSSIINGDLTLSFWFLQNTVINNKGLIQWANALNSTTAFLSIRVLNTSNGTLRFQVGDLTSRLDYTYSQNDLWQNVVITRTSSDNTWRFYVNGNLEGSYNDSGALLNQANAQTLYLGNGYNGFLNGKMSNLMLFNTALPETGTDSVETLYNNGVPLTTALASDNLKAWYKLDNTATFSTNWSVPDASGNGNTGTSSGMTEQNLVNNNVSALNGESSGMTSANLVLSDLTRAIPYDSYSFNFDGTNDYIDCGDSDIFSFGNSTTDSPFSISAWIKPASAPFRIVYKWGTSTQEYYFQIAGGGELQLILQDGAAYIGKNANTTIALNTWSHVLITYDGSSSANGINVYLNGNNDNLNNITSGTYTAMSNTTQPFEIGRYDGGSYADGKISNISIFNQELTSTEVLKLYANGVPQDLTNFTLEPIAWWPLGSNSFWNGSQWTVRDMIGSNDGTGQNIGIDGLVGDSPRSSANGVGTNNSIPENLEGTTKWSSNNSWSINMSSEARTTDVP